MLYVDPIGLEVHAQAIGRLIMRPSPFWLALKRRSAG